MCSILQHTATHCDTLQHTATHCSIPASRRPACQEQRYPKALEQHTSPHCNTLPLTLVLTASERPACREQKKKKQITCASHCNTLQHTATHCSILQQNAAYQLESALHAGSKGSRNDSRNTLQHTVSHCNTLQRTSQKAPCMPGAKVAAVTW